MKSIMFIFLLVLFLPLSSAHGLDFNSDRTPILIDNNFSIIQNVYGSYTLNNNTTLNGKIQDFNDSNAVFNYTFNFTSGNKYLRLQNITINPDSSFFFQLDYFISANVYNIEPFIFDLGSWPENITSPNIATLSTGPIAFYNEERLLLFPNLSNSCFYAVWKLNESTIISIIPSSRAENSFLSVDMAYLEGKEKKVFVEKCQSSGFLNERIDLLLYQPFFEIKNVTLSYENGTSKEIGFSNPDEVLKWNYSNAIVENGSAQFGSPYFIYNQFVSANKTFEKISVDEACNLKSSDWIYDGNQFYRIIKLKKEYIEDIMVELNGTLENYQTGEFFSSMKIKIDVNESSIKHNYPNDKVILSNLTFNYNGNSKIVNYNYEEKAYVFSADDIVLIGNPYLYPLDSYSTNIEVTGGEVIKKHQQFKSSDSGFNLDVDFNKKNINVKKSRTILSRYLLSVLLLAVVVYSIKKQNLFLHKDLLDRANFVITIMFGVTLLLAFDNLNYIFSIGILPFLAFFFLLSVDTKKN